MQEFQGKLLKRLLKIRLTEGKVLLIVTHDLDLAGELDYVIYVQQNTVK